MRKSPVFALAAVLAALLVPAVSHAGIPPVGLNVPGGAASAGSLAQVQASGAKYVRAFLIWNGSATPDSATLAAWDTVVNSYSAAGIKPEIVVSGQGGPPSDVNAYASYIGTLAARYGNKVAAWEIWNEEDEAIWWGTPFDAPGATNVAGYAALLKAAYPAVHPYAPVFVGGLTGNNYLFLDQLYTALGGSSAGAFDGVATHTDTGCSIVGPDSFYRNPDGRISQYSFLGLREVHATMDSHGDGAKPLWITELGWNTATGLCDNGMWKGQKNAGVSASDQASFLSLAWHCLADYPYVTNAMWFTLADTGSASNEQYGLLKQDGSQKPAWSAFKTAASGKDVDDGDGCGDFTPPAITVNTPANGAQFLDKLPITVTATDPGGVGRITLLGDGQKIRNWTTGQTDPTKFPTTLSTTTNGKAFTWNGASKLALGVHTITVIALDGSGNTATTTFQVNKVSPSAVTAVPTTFKVFKLVGKKGLKRTLQVQVVAASAAAGNFKAVNKVKIVFQKATKGKWVNAHSYAYSAKAPISVKVTLKPAKWRVFATFAALPPFLGSKSKILSFTVK